MNNHLGHQSHHNLDRQNQLDRLHRLDQIDHIEPFFAYHAEPRMLHLLLCIFLQRQVHGLSLGDIFCQLAVSLVNVAFTSILINTQHIIIITLCHLKTPSFIKEKNYNHAVLFLFDLIINLFTCQGLPCESLHQQLNHLDRCLSHYHYLVDHLALLEGQLDQQHLEHHRFVGKV